MTKKWAIVLLLLTGSLSFAQKRVSASHSIHEITASRPARAYAAIRDSVRILAIMVEFQKDSDDRTTGDGSFQKDFPATQIDPPPHDTLYFKNKLRFVENYFRQVSNGKLTVIADLCSQQIVELPNPMSFYSPPINLEDKSRLVELIKNSWQKADTLYPGIDFSNYDSFVIFHAGAGRDIDLVSVLGQNPTPYDIPTLYLDSASIAAVGNQLQGIPLRDSTIFIRNSIILPETESRVLSTGYGDVTLEYSINGLFAACIGSYLGLPDLFDTKTGRSAIGQFGLMDGAGIFAFNGLIPPEPSAWEKVFLGWVKPIVIQSSQSSIQIPAVGYTRSGQDTIYELPISSTEYFLLENRIRDPFANGVDVDFVLANGTTVRRHFNQDTTGFTWDWGAYDISGINGSVVDVSNFDWALPGQTDGTGKYDGGGILIWHIDENVIQNGLTTNTVNTNMEHRGVDLEEADASQDIGQIFDLLSPGSWSGYGSPLDSWFGGNLSVLYNNIFDRNSLPNSLSYTGAASLVTVKDFSSRAARMSLSVEIGYLSPLKRDSSLFHRIPDVNTYPASTAGSLFVPAQSGLYAIKSDGSSLISNPGGLIPAAGNIGEVAVRELPDSIFIAGSHNDTLEIIILSNPDINGVFNNVNVRSVTLNKMFSTSPCFLGEMILIGTDTGSVCKFSPDGNLISERTIGNQAIASLTQLPGPLEYYCTSGNWIYGESASVELPQSENKWVLAAAVSPGGNFIIAGEKDGTKVLCFDQSLQKKLFETNIAGPSLQEFAVGDMNGDGEKDIVVQSKTGLTAYNRLGVVLDGFPISARGNYGFTGTPLIMDVNAKEVITFTTDGEIWIYSGSGKLIEGTPVQASSSGNIYPAIYSKNQSGLLGIAVFSDSDSLNAFTTPYYKSTGSLIWPQHLGDEGRRNVESRITTINDPGDQFLPKGRVYNWPNPVYGNSTHIRYYTSEDAEITVTILDIAGVKITDLKGRGYRGMDNEIVWDVSNIQSGIYLARLEARSPSKTEVAFIKIAVVK